jgi:hypothetical protein
MKCIKWNQENLIYSQTLQTRLHKPWLKLTVLPLPFFPKISVTGGSNFMTSALSDEKFRIPVIESWSILDIFKIWYQWYVLLLKYFTIFLLTLRLHTLLTMRMISLIIEKIMIMDRYLLQGSRGRVPSLQL